MSGDAKDVSDGAPVVPDSLEKLLPLWEHPLGEVFGAGEAGGRGLQLTALRPELVTSDQELRLCVDTNEMLAEMESPYVPPLLEARRLADGRLVLAVERLQGMPLAQHMIEGPMAPERVIAILRQLCRALAIAHGLGVRHGALTAASVILVEHEGRADAVRLVDFGIEDALTVETMGDEEVETQPLSPEKVAGQTPEQTEDVYLLGAVGYAALAGRPLFEGDAKAVREAHEHAPPAALNCDTPLADVILRCLEKDPAKRFADVRSIDDALVGAQALAGLTTPWDDLRPMAGSTLTSAPSKPKPALGLGTLGRIPAGAYAAASLNKGKVAQTPAEKLAEKLKAQRRADALRKLEEEEKAAEEKVEPAEAEAEKVEAEKVEAEKVEAEKVEAEKPEAEKPEAEKPEAEKVEAEKKAAPVQELSRSASVTFDADDLFEEVPGPASSGAFAIPPPVPTVHRDSGSHAVVPAPPVPRVGHKTPIPAPPITSKAKGSGSSGSSFEKAGSSGSSFEKAGSSGSSFEKAGSSGSSFEKAGSSGSSFERAASLGLNLSRPHKLTPPPVPVVTSKAADSKPIPVAKADSKPTPAAKARPNPPIPTVKAKPAVAPAAGESLESMTADAVAMDSMTAEVAESLESMTADAVAMDSMVAQAEADTAEEPVPTAAAVPVPEPSGEETSETKKPPMWLIAAGLALLIGVPVAWLATRDAPPATTVAAGGEAPQPEPKKAETQPKPQPQPEPPPLVDAASAGTPEVAEGGVAPEPDPIANPEPVPEPVPVPVPEPEPEPIAKPKTPAGDGASQAAAPSPQDKARELIRAADKAYASGQLDKAATKYKAALAEYSRAHAAAAGLGRIAFNKAAYAESATYYGRAVKASVSNSGYRILYGDALFKLGKFADAKTQYAKAKSLGNGQADGRLKKVQGKLGG